MAFPSNTLCCPVCRAPLQPVPDESQFKCMEGHSFDRAKQGYLNLLLNQHKRSKHPGDTLEMVQAREHFLALGHYEPLLEKLVSLSKTYSTAHALSDLNLCDIACGEGYYSIELTRALKTEADLNVGLLGVDISQPAIKLAARKSKEATWIVANAFKLPIQSATQDLAMHLFSRPCLTEAERILKPDGHLIEVSTGDDHLLALRKMLYPEIKSHKPEQAENTLGSLRRDARHELRYEFELLENTHIANLLRMTPHLFKAKKDRVEKVKQLTSIKMNAHFIVETFTKN